MRSSNLLLLRTSHLNRGIRTENPTIPVAIQIFGLVEPGQATNNALNLLLHFEARRYKTETSFQPTRPDNSMLGQLRHIVQPDLHDNKTDFASRYHCKTKEHSGPERVCEALADRHSTGVVDDDAKRDDEAFSQVLLQPRDRQKEWRNR